MRNSPSVTEQLQVLCSNPMSTNTHSWRAGEAKKDEENEKASAAPSTTMNGAPSTAATANGVQ